MVTVHRNMAKSRSVPIILVLALLSQSFSVPIDVARATRGLNDNELESNETSIDSMTLPTSTVDEPSKVDLTDITTEAKSSIATPEPYSDEDDDDDNFGEPQPSNSGGGGSNIFSILRLAGALFPSSSGANPRIRKLIQELVTRYKANVKAQRRNDVDNEINVDNSDSTSSLSYEDPSTEEDNDSNDSEEVKSDESNKSNEQKSEERSASESMADENSAAEESKEEPAKGNGSKSKQDSASIDESDYDEPPGGDGNGGGVLGLIAGLSGGEDGQSDLGSLLSTVSGIVASLSGDGVDINAIIASGLGLFVGLLSEGNENPGSILASYLLTSLDTLTGGGAQNNGQFFGTFLSKLLKGTSAVYDPDASSEENGGVTMTDSGGFFISLIMGLLGDMSKGSSGDNSHPKPRLYLLDR